MPFTQIQIFASRILSSTICTRTYRIKHNPPGLWQGFYSSYVFSRPSEQCLMIGGPIDTIPSPGGDFSAGWIPEDDRFRWWVGMVGGLSKRARVRLSGRLKAFLRLGIIIARSEDAECKWRCRRRTPVADHPHLRILRLRLSRRPGPILPRMHPDLPGSLQKPSMRYSPSLPSHPVDVCGQMHIRSHSYFLIVCLAFSEYMDLLTHGRLSA